MDGIGLGRRDAADAVAAARTPNLDRLGLGLGTKLQAHGVAVGMPSDADMGNSEVGHNAMGAGRIVDQGAKLVHEALLSGAAFSGTSWRALLTHLRSTGGALHCIGLLSDGNVHSHIDHLYALLTRAHAEGIERAYVHALLDGRDVPKQSALIYIDALEARLARLGVGGCDYRIASGGGRMTTTMDRYQADWGMVARGWRAHVLGDAEPVSSARAFVEANRALDPRAGDQDLGAFVVVRDGRPVGPVRDGDAVIAFNFRGDRMLELCAAFEDDAFDKFDRGLCPRVYFAGMTLYDGDLARPKNYLVGSPRIACTFSELLCAAGVRQFACSETQKFGHVTYFWNGNRSGYFDPALEEYVEVPSLAPPFDARPHMRAAEITDAVLRALSKGDVQFLRLNYANGDMVGHTGNFAATVAAVEAVDREVGRLIEPVLARQGAVVVTADHGNADEMAERDRQGAILYDQAGRMVSRTSHSLAPVPCYVALHPDDRARFALADVASPGLGHIAATLATLLGFSCPRDYLPSLLMATRQPVSGH